MCGSNRLFCQAGWNECNFIYLPIYLSRSMGSHSNARFLPRFLVSAQHSTIPGVLTLNDSINTFGPSAR